MDDEVAFERAMLAAPDDDKLCRVFADWLDERSDRRGEFIRAWFSRREAAHTFELALKYWSNLDHTRDIKHADDFYDFWVVVYQYRLLARGVDRNWLWRLATGRPWVDLNVGFLIVTYIMWDYGLNWQAVAVECNTKLERAWLFRYDEPDAPSRDEGRDGPSWYLVHKLLGTFGDVGSRDPLSVMQKLERQA